MNETKVDVLAVMDTVDACLHSLRMDSDTKAQHITRFNEARAAVADLIEALQNIAALDPKTDSNAGFNEWGEAECFDKAQKIASDALARIGG